MLSHKGKEIENQYKDTKLCNNAYSAEEENYYDTMTKEDYYRKEDTIDLLAHINKTDKYKIYFNQAMRQPKKIRTIQVYHKRCERPLW